MPYALTCWKALLVAHFLFAIASAYDARAETWAAMPDGRAVVDMKGLQIAVPREGPDLNFLSFATSSPGTYSPMMLPHVLADPAAARRAFENAPQVSFRASMGARAPTPFLNRFNRFQGSFTISKGLPQNNCRSWARDFRRYRDLAAEKSLQADRWGWVKIDGAIEPRLGRSPLRTIFIKFANDSARDGSRYHALTCNLLGYCVTTKCLADDVSVTVRFLGGAKRQRDSFETFRFDQVLKNFEAMFQHVWMGSQVDLSKP